MSRALVALVVLLSAGGCGSYGVTSNPSGLTGRLATLSHYAESHCYILARRAATAQPFGSGPPIYPLANSYPLVAVGSVKPRGSAEMRLVKDGCAIGMVQAFTDAHSPKTALICRIQAQWLPRNLALCKGASST